MSFKKITQILLYPHIAVLSLLIPISTFLLAYSFSPYNTNNILSIASYVLAFYTLIAVCFRIPKFITQIKAFKQSNRIANRWLGDVRLRVNVTLTGNVIWNGIYAMLQLYLGICNSSLWFLSFAGYYFSLVLMRFYLLRHTSKNHPGENMQDELKHYRNCGWIFLLTNLALSSIVFLMLREDNTVAHNEIITITQAAYTFTSLTMAITNTIRYKKYNSPVFSASKAISLASATVSMLTLERTMLTTFRSENMTPQIEKLFLKISGACISIFIITMALYMIINSNRKLTKMNRNGK